MEIILTRDVKVKRYPLLAKLCVGLPRPDLVQLLNDITNNSQRTPERLKNYLEREKLWDVRNGLSTKGKSVLQSKTLFTNERGLYFIWYTDNDPLLGNRPILIERNSAQIPPNWENTIRLSNTNDWYLEKTSKVLFTQEKSTLNFEVETIMPEVVNASDKSTHLKLRWHIKKTTSTIYASNVILSGTIESACKETCTLTITLDIAIDEINTKPVLHHVAQNQALLWSDSYQAALSEPPTEINELSHFERTRNLSNLKNEFGAFTAVQLQNYPLMPRDEETAKTWLNHWLINLMSNDYILPNDLEKRQKAFLQHSAMQPYRLNPLLGKNLLGILNRQANPTAYWHCAALLDLLPSSKFIMQQKPFTYKDNDALDIDGLVKNLTLGQNNQFIIYSDRHYKSTKHSRNLSKITRTMSNIKGLVLTLPENNQTVPIGWKFQNNLSNTPETHDRYWVIKTEDDTLYWKCSTSLDFIDTNIPDCIRVKGSPTFTPIEENDIPNFLKKALESYKGEQTV